jgi:hypothetical protein
VFSRDNKVAFAFAFAFSVSKQQKNPRKLCKRHVENMWQEVTSYLSCQILSKMFSKAVSSSKNESIHYNSYNEQGSELVGNELTLFLANQNPYK